MGNHCYNPIVNKAIDEAIDQTFGVNATWNHLNEADILSDCVYDFLFFVLENLNIQCDNEEEDDFFRE